MEFSISIWKYESLFSLRQSYLICTWFVEQNLFFFSRGPLLFYNRPKFLNPFRTISDPYEPCTTLFMHLLQLVQLRLFLAFRLWARSIASLQLPRSDFVINLLARFIPRPVAIVQFKSINKNIESKQPEHTFFVLQFIVTAWVDWIFGIFSSRTSRGLLSGRLFFRTSVWKYWCHRAPKSSCKLRRAFELLPAIHLAPRDRCRGSLREFRYSRS